MILSWAWTNNRERVWIIYTPLLSSWQLDHRDCILNCLQHYSYFELMLGTLLFRLLTERWIGMQNFPYLCHFRTHLWKTTTLFYSLFFFFFYKAKTCLRSREVLFSQSFYAYSAHSFSHVKIFFLYLGHQSISKPSSKLPDSENRTVARSQLFVCHLVLTSRVYNRMSVVFWSTISTFWTRQQQKYCLGMAKLLLNINSSFILVKFCWLVRVLTRILEVGVRDSSVKYRSPKPNLGVPLWTFNFFRN